MALCAVVLACASWFMLIKSSLPDLYFTLSSKRGIPIKTCRLLEKCGLKVTKLRLDIDFFETCLKLDLCPPKFKLRDAKVNTVVLNKKIN